MNLIEYKSLSAKKWWWWFEVGKNPLLLKYIKGSRLRWSLGQTCGTWREVNLADQIRHFCNASELYFAADLTSGIARIQSADDRGRRRWTVLTFGWQISHSLTATLSKDHNTTTGWTGQCQHTLSLVGEPNWIFPYSALRRTQTHFCNCSGLM